MTDRNRRSWTAAILALMALRGVAMMVRGPLVDELGTAFRAPAWQLGLVATAGTAGYVVAIGASGLRAGHLDPRRMIVLGVVGTGLSALLMGVAPVFAVFLLGAFLRAATGGIIRGVDRPLLGHFFPDRRGRMFSYYDMSWAVGATAGPLVVVAVLAATDWRAVYYLLGVTLLVVAVVVQRFDDPAVEGAEEPLDRGDLRALLARPEILAMATLMFLASGVEGGLYLWLPLYAGAELSPTLATVSLSVLVAAYVPGRFVFGRLSTRVGYLRLLLGIAAVLLPTFAATVLVADGRWVLPGIVAVGVLVSGFYPLLVSYGTAAAPEFSGPVTAIAAVSSAAGMGTLPAVMGAVISGADAARGMQVLFVPLVLVVVVLAVARAAERRRRTADTAAAGN